MEDRVIKDAIVFVCRGFDLKEDMEKYIFPLEKVIINNFTNIPCYRVFLDDRVRRNVFFSDGSFVDDLDSCFNLLISKKAKNVYVVPLIPSYGNLYDVILKKADDFESRFYRVSIARPILNKRLQDFEMMALEKTLGSSEEAKEKLLRSVGEIIKIRKR